MSIKLVIFSLTDNGLTIEEIDISRAYSGPPDLLEPNIGVCELCNEQDRDLRPFGPDGKNICWHCGQKDKEGTTRRALEAMKARTRS